MLYLREDIEKRELAVLAPYAMKSAESEGRVHEQEQDVFRTCFQRDRDRIIQSKAFRRLHQKTQVFFPSTGDHYRNRMTHSVECSQISRGLARTFGLNEDLAEAIALAHDLGHTPFGHAGEHEMDKIMKQFGMHFEHNEQSLRIVEQLDKISPDFDGLNLTKEVLDGLLKHRTPYDRPKMEFSVSAHLEAQLVDLADEIAYTSGDVDDGLRSEAFSYQDIRNIPLLARIMDEVLTESGNNMSEEIFRHRISSSLMHAMVTDLCEYSTQNLKKNNISSVAGVRKYNGILISFSPDFYMQLKAVREFLKMQFYFGPMVSGQNAHGQNVIRHLFEAYLKDQKLLPEKLQEQITSGERREIVIKDYIAGMTDSFAEKQLVDFT